MRGQEKQPQYARIPLWACGVRLSGDRAWRVYLAIAIHADNITELAYVGTTRIFELTRIDREKLTKLVTELERAGLIRKEGFGKGPGMKHPTTIYRVFQVSPYRGTVSEAEGVPLQGSESPPTGMSGVPLQGGKVSPYRGTRTAKEQLDEQLSEQRCQLIDGANPANGDDGFQPFSVSQMQPSLPITAEAPFEPPTPDSDPAEKTKSTNTPAAPRGARGFVVDTFFDGRVSTRDGPFGTLDEARQAVGEALRHEAAMPSFRPEAPSQRWRIEIRDSSGRRRIEARDNCGSLLPIEEPAANTDP